MKKALSIVLCVFLLLALTACNSKSVDESDPAFSESTPESTSEESSGTGHTKKLVSKQINKNGTGEVTQTSEYEYDSKGRVSVVKNVFNNGTNYIYTSYDENGYESESITKNENGAILSHHQFEHDEYGYMYKWRVLNENGTVKNENVYDVERDEQGRLLKVYANGELSHWYSYDEAGNATERMQNADSYNIYDKDGKTLESGSGDYKMIYTYENGLIKEINSQNSETVYKSVFEYDGELLLSQTNYENGNITLQYLYEYDEEGNRTKQTMQNALGIASSIVEYYYDEYPIED
ncbi:MAG: hypothetical protein IKK70_01165 [Clostridia bacterium]|nr:hypothetical protein [Clostridia bacterium]